MPTHQIKNREVIHSFQLLGKLDDLKGIKGAVKLRLAKIGSSLRAQHNLIIENRNKVALEAFPETVSTEKDKSVIPAGTVDPKSVNFPNFAKKVDEMLEETISLDLPILRASELNLDNNDLPFTVLMGLDWLIIQDVNTEEESK